MLSNRSNNWEALGSLFGKFCGPEVSQKCIREPIYGTEALYFRNVYNPNTVRVNGVKAGCMV